jgi:hypothetical protein
MVEVYWNVYGYGFGEHWRWKVFLYIVLQNEWIEKWAHNTFGFSCAHVSTKILYIEKLSICYYNQNMDTQESLERVEYYPFFVTNT